jgi:prolyl-tRNA synthetase
MKFSNTFIPTTKEDPKDAVLKSHQYLVRGGFINQVGAGIYNYLPLGLICLEKIKNIINQKLQNAGCVQTQLGFVTPSKLWKDSGRFQKYGKELLRFNDRKNNEFVLSPTAEEMMVELVKNRITSYKELPINLYQINTKFRDELRPRFGLMRGREFIMKDGYSFHENENDMIREFNLMEKTYKEIFSTLGLDHRVVEADSGAIGGEGSKEFMVLANSGEDTIVVCDNCEYGANIEASIREPKTSDCEKPKGDFGKFHTPSITKIEDVAKYFYIDTFYTIKAVIKKAIFDDCTKIAVFFVRGNDELQEVKAINSINANDIVDATEEEIEASGLIAGFVGFKDLPENILSIVDNELKKAKNMVIGANEKDYHFVNIEVSKIENLIFDDLVTVQEGDFCKCCATNGKESKLKYTKGIEAGHIFQLGTKYSEVLDANFLDQNGKKQPFVMGTYGIGVSRLLSAIIEQNHDEKGMIWTKQTAPYLVDVIVSNIKKDDEVEFANKIYEELKSKNIDVILDDRKDRFGAKISDFELIGFPYAIIIGKGLKDNLVQIVNRKTLEKEDVSCDEVITKIEELLK